MKKKIITVISGSRADYAALKYILRILNKDKSFKLNLVITGSHLFSKNKLLLDIIKKDGLKIHKKINVSTKNFTPNSISKSIGLGVINFSKYFTKYRPDLILVLGDRFEIFASVISALPFNIPVAHIEGGEITEGAFDDAIRHSITKLSHFHFVSNKIHKKRVKQLGEESWRIFISGSPCIDTIKFNKQKSLEFLKLKYNFKINKHLIIVTFHPVTLEYKQTKDYINELLKALREFNSTIIFTSPNQDTNSNIILKKILKFVKNNDNAYFVNNFGSEDYLSILKYASLIVGNSSSGIIEAPSFKLPVVNIGSREAGRLRAKNVLDVNYKAKSIIKAIQRGLTKEFRNSLRTIKNPYGNGEASRKIACIVKNLILNKPDIIKKKFSDHEIK